MYNNVGRKLKTVAHIICWVNSCLGILYSVYSAFVIYRNQLVIGLLVIIIGSIISIIIGWLSGLVLYAFGELVERVKSIDEEIHHNDLNDR